MGEWTAALHSWYYVISSWVDKQQKVCLIENAICRLCYERNISHSIKD